MEEFVYVVLAGAIIFLLAGVIAGLPEFKGEEKLEDETLFSENFGSIGEVDRSHRGIDLQDVSIGTTRGNKTVENIEEAEIKNGYTSYKERVIEFHAEDPREAYISFKVAETNTYGDLSIYANGDKVVSSEMMTGITPEFVIDEDKLVKGHNEIKIKAESPGLKFWAPNIYVLNDIELKVNDYGRFELNKPFKVYEYEMRSFLSGELKFFVEESVRPNYLNVEINGRNVYKEKPIKRPRPYEISFYANETQLKPGENQLKIWAGNGSEYKLVNPKLNIHYYGTPERTTIQREFEISRSQYEVLKKEENRGIIKFDGKVYVPQKFEIYLENETMSFYPETGDNKYYFDESAVVEGENSLRLETEGSIDIKNFRIEVEENES